MHNIYSIDRNVLLVIMDYLPTSTVAVFGSLCKQFREFTKDIESEMTKKRFSNHFPKFKPQIDDCTYKFFHLCYTMLEAWKRDNGSLGFTRYDMYGLAGSYSHILIEQDEQYEPEYFPALLNRIARIPKEVTIIYTSIHNDFEYEEKLFKIFKGIEKRKDLDGVVYSFPNGVVLRTVLQYYIPSALPYKNDVKKLDLIIIITGLGDMCIDRPLLKLLSDHNPDIHLVTGIGILFSTNLGTVVKEVAVKRNHSITMYTQAVEHISMVLRLHSSCTSDPPVEYEKGLVDENMPGVVKVVGGDLCHVIDVDFGTILTELD